MPSDTLPRATDSKTAPRPLSHACADVKCDGAESITHSSVVLESYAGLCCIWCLHKDELVLPRLVKNALHQISGLRRDPTKTRHVVPGRHDRLHVEIGREKDHNAIRYNLAVFNEEGAEVSDHRRIIPDFKAGRYWDLVVAAGHDEREETVARQRHGVRLHDSCAETEHLRVHVERRDGTRSDDDAAESLKDGRYREGGIEACQAEKGIGDGCVLGLERLEYQAEAW
jgi:hypothetical protein